MLHVIECSLQLKACRAAFHPPPSSSCFESNELGCSLLKHAFYSVVNGSVSHEGACIRCRKCGFLTQVDVTRTLENAQYKVGKISKVGPASQ